MFLDTRISSYTDAVSSMLKSAKDISMQSKDFAVEDLASAEFCMVKPDVVHFKSRNIPREFELTDFSTSQLCQRLGMPTQYFEALAKSKNESLKNLACTNINVLAGHSKTDVLFRTYQNTVRGFLSTSYVPFDSDEIITVIDDVVSKSSLHNDLCVRGHFLTPERFHMRFTTPLALKGVRDNDLFVGLQVDSSDVGKASLSVRFYIFKQVCTNGLCIAQFDSMLFKQRHIHLTADDFNKGLKHSLEVFPEVTKRAIELINSAANTNIRGSRLFNLEDNETLRKNVQAFLRVSSSELEDIVSIASTQYEPTIWGFTNAVTQRAREMPLERRLDVERMAGNFLTGYRRLGVAA